MQKTKADSLDLLFVHGSDGVTTLKQLERAVLAEFAPFFDDRTANEPHLVH